MTGSAGWMVRWPELRPRVLEVFVVFNLAFLALDIYLAHSVNAFAKLGEWIPFYFSLAGSAVLAVAVWRDRCLPDGSWAKPVGSVIGYLSIAVGIAGLFYHLDSQFFQQMSLQSMVYTAPLAAPLSYVGLGFLLLLNRHIRGESREWQQWVLLFTCGGFVGNFGLSLADHAQNGFFHWTEWIPVFSSAFAIGFLGVSLWDLGRPFQRLSSVILMVQAAVGVLGFGLHLGADVNGLSANAFQNFIYGAPLFAPLLFTDLFLLGAIGLAEAWLPAGPLPDAAG